MKTTKLTAVALITSLIILALLASHLYAASIEPAPISSGGGPYLPGHDDMSPATQAVIQNEINHNLGQLAAADKLPAVTIDTVLLDWPLRPSSRLADYGYHGVSGFVDHNPNYPFQRLDFQCGQRTYDTPSGYNHQGTDYFLWPFAFNKMDADEVQVVAAAPGILIFKEDGRFDRSCTSNDDRWNAAYILHNDGSTAWYGHLKNGSVTNKSLGSQIAPGEYLGIVGSSGNSTGPHLHLELHDAEGELIDPYAGSCNGLNPESLWLSQRPYYDSAINKLTTGPAPVDWQTCPLPDIPNIGDSFQPGDDVYFTTYYRDQLDNQVSQYAIYQPDGSLFTSWSHQMDADHYPLSWWWWGFELEPDALTGTWRFEVEFNGRTDTTHFNVGEPTNITINTPEQADQWGADLQYAVTWEDNLGGPVRLELWRDGVFVNVITTSTPSNGRYNWHIPAHTPYADNYQIRIIDLADETVMTSSFTFAIVDPVSLRPIQFLTPTMGTIWTVGEPMTITWTAVFSDNIRLQLLHGNVIAATPIPSSPNGNQFTWDVPASFLTSSDYRLRLTDLRFPHNQVMSDPFAIWNPVANPIWIRSPNGGEFWDVGSEVTMVWTTAVTEPVRLELHQGSAITTTVTTTVSTVTNNNGFTWTVPLTITQADDYWLRVVSVLDTTIYDDSDTPFTIWKPRHTYLPILKKQ